MIGENLSPRPLSAGLSGCRGFGVVFVHWLTGWCFSVDCRKGEEEEGKGCRCCYCYAYLKIGMEDTLDIVEGGGNREICARCMDTWAKDRGRTMS